MQEMKFDFDGLIQLLAHHLYSEKKIFIRELIQNAHDAIKRREALPESPNGGRIVIDSRPSELTIAIKDDGIGMSRDDLENYLSNIGKSFTKTQKNEIEGLIGQFGIGFLSAFVVARSVEVRTRKWGEDSGWLWQNNGSKDYLIEPCEVKQPGTTVTVYLRGEEDKGLIHQEAVQQLIRYYADMLTVPIYLNGAATPTNTMNMPWEKQGQTEIQMKFNCRIYLEQTLFDAVLEAIPVNLSGEVNAQGVLYLTRVRRLVDSPRQIRVFQNRMFICDNVPDILPQWASFVNGVINSPDLTPTAARDNFRRDEKANKLRDALGNLVISHLENLHISEPVRFADILHFHNLGIKAACFYHDDFYEKFAHLLKWRTNKGERKNLPEDNGRIGDRSNWMTLPQILAKLPKNENEPQRLPCFTTSNSANQFFQMADAAGSYVVDASWPFESYLIEQYTKLKGVSVWLIHVDKEDDPNVYLNVDPEEEYKFSRLAESMNRRIAIKGIGTIRAEVKKFKPHTLAAVIKANDSGRGLIKAQDVLNDPNASQEMRDMAMELYERTRGSNLKITINGNNDLIQKLANQDLDNIEVIQIMAGVYNGALLMNQELMTPSHAKYFYDQFQKLLMKNLAFLEIEAELNRKRREAEDSLRKQSLRNAPKQMHKIFFMVTPFAKEYQELMSILRIIIEDNWGCQLFIRPLS
jgi:molecular chaperone HtpG